MLYKFIGTKEDLVNVGLSSIHIEPTNKYQIYKRSKEISSYKDFPLNLSVTYKTRWGSATQGTCLSMREFHVMFEQKAVRHVI